MTARAPRPGEFLYDYFNPKVCDCCGNPYHEGRGCFGVSGYLCMCDEAIAFCIDCHKCSHQFSYSLENKAEKYWEARQNGHCQCYKKRAEEERIQKWKDHFQIYAEIGE